MTDYEKKRIIASVKLGLPLTAKERALYELFLKTASAREASGLSRADGA